EAADAVDEEFPVQVVNFVLQSNGEEVFGLQYDLFFIGGPSFYLDLGSTLHFGSIINHAEATFLPNNLALAGGDDGIDEFEQLLTWFFVVDIDDNDALWDADLHCGQADARRVVHSQHHVVYQMHQVTGNVLDCNARLFEARVRKVKDVSNHCS